MRQRINQAVPLVFATANTVAPGGAGTTFGSNSTSVLIWGTFTSNSPHIVQVQTALDGMTFRVRRSGLFLASMTVVGADPSQLVIGVSKNEATPIVARPTLANSEQVTQALGAGTTTPFFAVPIPVSRGEAQGPTGALVRFKATTSVGAPVVDASIAVGGQWNCRLDLMNNLV